MGKILGWSILLNLLFVLVEAGVGFSQGSLSLLSDAGHNLSDVFSLILVAVGFRLSKLHANARFTYGYRKSTILISLLNAIILLLAVGGIIIEAIHKFSHPMPVNGAAVGWTAFVGIIVNGATTLLLMRRQKGDLNVRGAFLHMAADTLVSVGVVISGVIIACTGVYVIDPFISLCIALIILISTWRLLSSSLRLSLDGTPEGISLSRRQLVVGGRKDGKHLAAAQGFVVATGLENPGEVTELVVLLDGLPEGALLHTSGNTVIMVVPRISAGCEDCDDAAVQQTST